MIVLMETVRMAAIVVGAVEGLVVVAGTADAAVAVDGLVAVEDGIGGAVARAGEDTRRICHGSARINEKGHDANRGLSLLISQIDFVTGIFSPVRNDIP